MKIKFLGNLMIYIGILMLLSIALINFNIKFKSENLVKDFENKKNEKKIQDIKSEENKENEEKTQEVKHEENKKNEEKIQDINTGDTIGIIKIPKIDLKLSIQEGVEKENIKHSLGHFPNTPMPWEGGNFCLAGHRAYSYGTLLNRLNELEKNDVIFINTLDYDYEYKVYDIQVVTPESVDVLDNTSNDIITIITCTPIYIGTHRLVIKGTLINTTNNS